MVSVRHCVLHSRTWKVFPLQYKYTAMSCTNIHHLLRNWSPRVKMEPTSWYPWCITRTSKGPLWSFIKNSGFLCWPLDSSLICLLIFYTFAYCVLCSLLAPMICIDWPGAWGDYGIKEDIHFLPLIAVSEIKWTSIMKLYRAWDQKNMAALFQEQRHCCLRALLGIAAQSSLNDFCSTGHSRWTGGVLFLEESASFSNLSINPLLSIILRLTSTSIIWETLQTSVHPDLLHYLFSSRFQSCTLNSTGFQLVLGF